MKTKSIELFAVLYNGQFLTRQDAIEFRRNEHNQYGEFSKKVYYHRGRAESALAKLPPDIQKNSKVVKFIPESA